MDNMKAILRTGSGEDQMPEVESITRHQRRAGGDKR